MNLKENEAFMKTMAQHCDHLHFLKLSLIAAELKKQEIDDMFKAVYNEVLQNHAFYAGKDFERFGIRKGERILEEEDTYLLDKKDFDILLQMVQEKNCLLNYTDSEGYYRPGFNGMEILQNAEKALFDFMLSILPIELKAVFEEHKNNYSIKKRFINIIMGNVD